MPESFSPNSAHKANFFHSLRETLKPMQAWLRRWLPGFGSGNLWRLLAAFVLLLVVHRVGDNIAGQRINQEANWPTGAHSNPELRRGMELDAYLAIVPEDERNSWVEIDAFAANSANSADQALPERGVFVDVNFTYNRPLHALVLCVVCGLVCLLLITVHPLWVLPALIFTYSKVGEFYPITDWPMYSDPSTESSWYCYMADGEGVALPVRILCGETSPKLKKRMRSYTSKMLKLPEYDDLGSREDLPEEAWEQAAQRVLREMTARSVEVGQQENLPSQLQLMRVDIYQEKGGFREEVETLGSIETAQVLQALKAQQQ